MGEMARLLITTGIYPPDIGGPATYAKMLVDHWGDRVMVVTYTKGLRRVPKPFRQLIYFLKTWSAAARTDAIYSLSPLGTGVASAVVAKWRKKKFFVRVAGDRAWEDAVVRGKTRLLIGDFQKLQDRGFKHRMQVWVCKKASTVIVPSQYLANLVAGWGIEREKIKIVHNAVNPVEALPRQSVGIPGKIILSVGRLVPWKGFRLLIKLMPQFLEINPFFRLVIVGDGPDRKLLETMMKNLKLQNKVFLVGKKSSTELAQYLVAADLFILNTGYEGFSHQIVEAMSHGVPVITTSVGGNREVIRQGENGFMVKYNDEFNIIEAVKTLWQSPELRAKFIEEGRATAAQFSVERMIKETENIFHL